MLAVLEPPLLAALSASAAELLSQFNAQGLANLAWSCASLEIADEQIFKSISEHAATHAYQFDAQELSNTAWSFAYLKYLNDPILATLSGISMQQGLRKDQLQGCVPLLWPAVRSMGPTPLGHQEPRVVVNAPGFIVLMKPAGWETDVYDVSQLGVPISPVTRFYLLSSFLAASSSEEQFPISRSADSGFGFIHRLDQMSSGLILTATCFLHHAFLQFQMATYQIDREYFVLCHGLLPPESGTMRISARLREGAARGRERFGERCLVDPRGKPALSYVTALSFAAGSLQDRYTSVAISIWTGRQHQIRVHLQHLGHPSVHDGRYTDQRVFLQEFRSDAH